MRDDKITIDPAAGDPWDKQPNETARRYGYFCIFRDLGPTRTLVRAASDLSMSYGHTRDTASTYRWSERATAWDIDKERLARAKFAERRLKAMEADAQILDMMVAKFAKAMRERPEEDFTPGELVRMGDVAMRHRRALYGDATAVVTVQGPEGSPLSIELADYTTMSPSDRIKATADLAADVLRRSAAAATATEEPDYLADL